MTPDDAGADEPNVIDRPGLFDGPRTLHAPEPTLVGVVAPYDLAMDRELWRWVPSDVSLLFTRTPYAPLGVTGEMAEWVSRPESVRRAAEDLAAVRPAACVYACTTGSFVHGTGGEEKLSAELKRSGASVAVTTSGALLAALAALGIGTVSLATPYDEQLTGQLAAFLAERRHRVDHYACLELHGGIWQVPYAVTADLIRSADSPAAEAVVVSCTNLATYDLIAPLEAELGKPVITANQAMTWATMTALGRRAVGPGQRLLREGDIETVVDTEYGLRPA